MNNKKQSLNVPPHSEEAELAVLGSMLSSKEAVSKAIQHLKENYLYKNAHSTIFSVMVHLFDKGISIDPVSVIDLLKKNKDLE